MREHAPVWGPGRRPQALGIIPASFVALMLAGGALAHFGVPLPLAEWTISLSVIVLGLLVAATPALPLSVGAGLVGLFAVFHGHAHVAEMGGQAAAPYMLGFAVATLALHAAAIVVGLGLVRSRQPLIVRFAGAGIAAGFAVLMMMN